MEGGDLGLLSSYLSRRHLSLNRHEHVGSFSLRSSGDFSDSMVRCHSLASALQHEEAVSQAAGCARSENGGIRQRRRALAMGGGSNEMAWKNYIRWVQAISRFSSIHLPRLSTSYRQEIWRLRSLLSCGRC